MSLASEVLALRRRGSELSNKWRALGGTLVGPDGETLARFNRPELAELTARVHNLWLTLSNQWLLSVRAQQDRAAMTTTEKDDECVAHVTKTRMTRSTTARKRGSK